jgi:tetratricopeptide (TPR) repeat protein
VSGRAPSPRWLLPGLASAAAGLLLAVPLLFVVFLGPAAAQQAPGAAELASVQAAVARGAFSEAIDQLEHWSDQGLVHATLSFDRGVAYLGRAESSARKPADLGQAAAAFEEALALEPADEEARVVLQRIRETISERRARAQDSGVVARPRLLRALTGLIGEGAWAGAALLGSLLLALGLAARLFLASHETRLGGAILAVAGGCLLLLGGSMAAAGRHLRRDFSPAVVIVEEARLLDPEGRPITGARGPSALDAAGDRVPEGSLVHVVETRGALARIEWADGDAWLNAAHLRRITRGEN